MKNKYLTPSLCHFLCNVLIQPHFFYASSAQYTHLSKKLKNKIQSSQNKCIRFFLQLDKSLVGLALWNKTSDENKRTTSLKIFNITKFKVKWYLNFKIKKKLSLLLLVSLIVFYDYYYCYDYCYNYFNY